MFFFSRLKSNSELVTNSVEVYFWVKLKIRAWIRIVMILSFMRFLFDAVFYY